METYNVLKNLGRGTFGTVYLCERKHNKLKIVVKEIYIDSNAEHLKICKNEVSVLKVLNHPNIIQYFDSFNKNGSFYIVMEFASGGTLHEYIKFQKPKYLLLNKVMSIFCQILMAVEHMHYKKIMHRDLKSENIFLTGANCDVIKIGDFGISKALQGIKNGKTVTPIGTTNYVAPEVCDGKPYDLKCDVWSLGCILYELCARDRLYDGPISEVVMAIKSGRRKMISIDMYGIETQQIIDACLQMNPEERPSSKALTCFPQIFPHVQTVVLNLGNIEYYPNA